MDEHAGGELGIPEGLVVDDDAEDDTVRQLDTVGGVDDLLFERVIKASLSLRSRFEEEAVAVVALLTTACSLPATPPRWPPG
jgi:hypothetical protein